jgi:hypothetical protein
METRAWAAASVTVVRRVNSDYRMTGTGEDVDDREGLDDERDRFQSS